MAKKINFYKNYFFSIFELNVILNKYIYIIILIIIKMEAAAYAIDFKIIREGENIQIIERVAIVDCDRIIRKGTNGIIISMSAVALVSEEGSALENNYKSINIIIENPENAKGVIIGNLELPFPEEGETKIQTINDIISIKLLKIKNSNNTISSFLDKADKAPVVMSPTYANRVNVNKVINPRMNELLKNSIIKYKKEFHNHNCYEKNNKSNCIIEESKLNR